MYLHLPYLNQEVWRNPINSILESSDSVNVNDLIIESLIQSYGDDFIGLEMQIIFSQMKPYFIEEVGTINTLINLVNIYLNLTNLLNS